MSLYSKISNTAKKATNLLDNMTSLSGGVLCLPSLLKDLLSPSFYLKSIQSVFDLIKGSLFNIIRGLVNSQIAKITGIITSVSNLIRNTLALITSEVNQVVNTVNELYNSAYNLINTLKSKPNCANASANIFNCLNKVVSNKLTNNVVAKMYDKADQLSESILSTVETDKIITNIANKELEFADKIKSQTRL